MKVFTACQDRPEFSTAEYAALPKRFPDEQIFNGPDVTLVCQKWGITVAARAGYIRKILADHTSLEQAEADAIFSDTRGYWLGKLGQPTEETSSRIIWVADTDSGNVIVVRRHGVPYVTLALTSRLELRSNSDRETIRDLRDELRNTEFIIEKKVLSGPQSSRNGCGCARRNGRTRRASSHNPLSRYCLYSSIGQCLSLVGLFALDVLWAFICYKYVNVRASSYMANFVILAKWPAAIASAIILFVHHQILAGALAIAWPMGLGGLISCPR